MGHTPLPFIPDGLGPCTQTLKLGYLRHCLYEKGQLLGIGRHGLYEAAAVRFSFVVFFGKVGVARLWRSDGDDTYEQSRRRLSFQRCVCLMWVARLVVCAPDTVVVYDGWRGSLYRF